MSRTSRFRPLFWLAGLASLAGSVAITWGLHAFNQSPGQNAADDVQSDHRMAHSGVVCFGHVDVEQGVSRLASAQNGRIAAVLVREGQTIKQGDPLVQLDDQVQVAQLTQARQALQGDRAKREQARLAIELRATEVHMQQAVLDAAKDRLARVERELDRCRTELKDMVSARVLDDLNDKARDLRLAVRLEEDKLTQARLQVDVARQDHEAATAAVAFRDQQVNQAEKAVAECRLQAPFAGLVLRVRARLGELVGPMFPEPLVELCPDQPRLIRAEVAQEFAAVVGVGAACEIHDDYGTDEVRWRGTITRVSGWYAQRRSILFEPLQLNDARTLECIIQLEPSASAGTPRIGQRMRAVIGHQRTR